MNNFLIGKTTIYKKSMVIKIMLIGGFQYIDKEGNELNTEKIYAIERLTSTSTLRRGLRPWE